MANHVPLVLLVEDDPVVRRMASGLLRSSSMQVASCDGTQNGTDRPTPLELLDGRCPDLAVVDWHLEGGDASELMMTLDELYPSTPIVVFSADGRPEVRSAAMRAGAWRWIDKAAGGIGLGHAVSEGLKEQQRRSTGKGFRTLPEIERYAILSAVRRFGSVRKAQPSLGVPLRTLYSRLESYASAS